MPKEIFNDLPEKELKEKKSEANLKKDKKTKKIDKEQVEFAQKLIAPMILGISLLMSLIVYLLS